MRKWPFSSSCLLVLSLYKGPGAETLNQAVCKLSSICCTMSLAFPRVRPESPT